MPLSSHAQLPLGIGLHDSATFANYYAGDNAPVVHALQSDEPFVYLWGGSGCGKSHLLQAACHACAGGPVYLPLAEPALSPLMCEGLEAAPLVAVDDVQSIVGEADWEEALFHLYNRIRAVGTRLLVAGEASPLALGLKLPDLASRLSWGPVFQLRPLEDAQKVEALIQRAAGRGIEISVEVANYLLRRCPRDMHSLFALLDRLDHASLAAQRRLTIPFVRELLGGV